MRCVLVAALLMALLAGCSDGGSDCGSSCPTEATPTPGDGLPVLEAPVFEVGDWWNFTSPATGDYSVVVAEASPQEYLFRTDNPAVAFFDQRFDISYFGPQRASDLAGSQGTERIEFFHWPLEGNMEWTTMWDGIPITIITHRADADTVHLMASNGTQPYAEYTYDAKAHWISEMRFYAPDGSVGFEARLHGYGNGFSGLLASWDVEPIAEESGDLATVQPLIGQFELRADVTDVYVDLELHCTAGVAGLGVAPVPFAGAVLGLEPRGAGSPADDCPMDEVFHGVAGTPQPQATGTDENWGYDILSTPATTGTYSLMVMLRTLVQTPL